MNERLGEAFREGDYAGRRRFVLTLGATLRLGLLGVIFLRGLFAVRRGLFGTFAARLGLFGTGELALDRFLVREDDELRVFAFNAVYSSDSSYCIL